uniref:Junctional adhesion molecule A n=1 Tax=Sphenodon punctatus TaxID=8508 RepID=A0A8D0L685_SPHPU
IDLPCTAQGGNSRVEWKFQRGSSLALVYYNSKLTDNYKSRVELYPTGIRFKSVTRKDTGTYTCEVINAAGDAFLSVVNLVVQVPPSKPTAKVPTSATIGSNAVLKCIESDGSPLPTFTWYKDNVLLPTNPKASPLFRNSSYTIDEKTGVLAFEPLTGFDTGEYHCEAKNGVGSGQKSEAIRMEATELNVGGIVAAVVVVAIVLGLIGFGVWFACSRG